VGVAGIWSNEKVGEIDVEGQDAGQMGKRNSGGSDSLSSRNLPSENVEGSSRYNAQKKNSASWQRELWPSAEARSPRDKQFTPEDKSV